MDFQKTILIKYTTPSFMYWTFIRCTFLLVLKSVTEFKYDLFNLIHTYTYQINKPYLHSVTDLRTSRNVHLMNLQYMKLGVVYSINIIFWKSIYQMIFFSTHWALCICDNNRNYSICIYSTPRVLYSTAYQDCVIFYSFCVGNVNK